MYAYLTISTMAVRLLTRVLRHGRILGGALWLSAGFLQPAFGDTLSNSGWQPVAEIKAAAETYIREQIGGDDERVVPTAGHLDPRLQLARCSAPLAPYLQNRKKTTGRIIVGVRCDGDRPWNIYLPVHVAVMQDVLVTAVPLSRDHAIGRQDVEVARRDVSTLVGGYMTDVTDVLGQRLKRSVAKGTLLTPAQVSPAILIERGQTVTLTVESASLNISMTGKALMDGTANQRIRVENLASGRVVEGLVVTSENVRVLMQ